MKNHRYINWIVTRNEIYWLNPSIGSLYLRTCKCQLKKTQNGTHYIDPSIGSLFVKNITNVNRIWHKIELVIQNHLLVVYIWIYLEPVSSDISRTCPHHNLKYWKYTLDAHLSTYLTRVPNIKIERFFLIDHILVWV